MDKSSGTVLESCQAMEQGQRVEAAGRDEVNEGAGRVASGGGGETPRDR